MSDIFLTFLKRIRGVNSNDDEHDSANEQSQRNDFVHNDRSWTSAPMDVATLSQVPRKTREKEAGGGGVTTQADRVQQCTAQGSSGKVGGAHGR